MAKSKSIGGIYAELSLRDTSFRKGLKRAALDVGNFAGMAIKAGAVASGALATGLAIGTKKAIAMGAELDHMASQTGVAVSSLMVLQQSYRDSGKDASSAAKDINKMQRAIYEAAENPGGTNDYFAALGLSAEKLMAMSPERQFYEIGDAIKKTKDQTKQAALAMSIFGRSGGELLTVFKGSALDDVNESLGRMPETMEKFSGAMERADTLMGRLPGKSDQFFTGFTAGVIGQLLPGLEQADDFDFTDLGENLGDAIANGVQLITDGKVWDVFALQAEKAGLEIERSLSGVFSTINAGLSSPSDVFMAGLMNPEAMARIGSSANNFRDSGNAEINILEDQIAEQIEEIMKVTRSRSRSKKSAALIGKGIGPLFDQGIPDWLNNLPLVGPKSFDMFGGNYGREMERQSSPWESTRYDVNEMQARGLAMGGVYVDKEEKKQTTILTTIRDILKKAETSGELKWA